MISENQSYKRRESALLIRLALLTVLVVFVSIILVSSFLLVNLHSVISADRDYYYQSRFDYDTKLIDQQLFSPVVELYEELKILKNWRLNMTTLSLPSQSQTNIVNMRDLLKQRLTLTGNVIDIAVYSPSNNFIVSALSGVCFMDDPAVPSPQYDSDWVEQTKDMRLASPVKWLSRREYPKGIGTDGDVFSYVAMASYVSGGGGYMYVCISVPCDAFLSMTDDDEGTLFMIDSEGSVILGNAEGAYSFDTEGRFVRDDTVYYVTASDVAPWRYVMAIPLNVFSSRTNALTARTLTVSLLVLVLMAALCYGMLRRLTSPFNAMLERARKLHIKEYDRKHGDLQFVADSFGTYISKAELIQKQLDDSRSTLRKSFLMSCISGRRMEEKELQEYFEFLGIGLPLPYYRLLIVSSGQAAFTALDESRMEKIAERVESEGIRLLSAGCYDRTMYIIVNSDADSEGTGSLLEDEINNSVFGYDVSVIESERKDSLQELSVSLIRPEVKKAEHRPNDAVNGCTFLAEKYINENYHRDISVQDIADAAAVSRSHLSRLFKEERGMTMLEYLLGVRLTAAMKLLDETDMNINTISEMVGFNNTNYFYKCFKAHFGQTPNEYRSSKSKS